MTLAITKKLENKLTTAMQNAFQSTSDRKKAVHLAAAAGAGIVATLPIGADVWGLRACEIILIVCIASSYGEKMTKSAAKGLMLSSFAQLVGEAAAITALEAAEAAKIATVGTGIGAAAAFSIKSGIAVSLIEAVGHMTIAYYEKPDSIPAKLSHVAEGIGAAADVSRVVTAVSGKLATAAAVAGEETAAEGAISFTGRVEGTAHGHTESYWRDRLKSAIKRQDEVDIKYYTKWLQEAIENRPKP